MASENNNITEEKKSLNFIEAKVEKDLAEGKHGGRIQTRFPPEPTDTCISDTLRLSLSISVSLRNMAEYVTSEWTTPTHKRKILNT